MNLLFLCRERDLGFGQASLARALERQGAQVKCVKDSVTANEDIGTLLADCDARPDLILQPELNFPLLPANITEIDIPTACLQIDTYAYTDRRISWSMLFDFPVVYHPGYEEKFCRAGHSGVVTFYHAASRELFDKPPLDRVFDIGSVGRTHAAVQSARQRVMKMLAEKYRLNEWEKLHTFEEMAEVYRRSKIVVNVPRDDFPQDANMRAFEAMAAGCLLISRTPSELTSIGFEEGVHFAGYSATKEIPGLVARYLEDERERERIAQTGRAKVLAEHTYDNRARQLLDLIDKQKGKFFAPARTWPKERIALTYVDYYCAHAELGLAAADLWRARADLGGAAIGAGLVARAIASRARGRLNAALQWSK